MIQKPRMVVVNEIDDSIKSKSSTNEVVIFQKYLSFKEYVESRPYIVDTLIITTKDLPFTNSNMDDLLKLLRSPFLKVKEFIYLIPFDIEETMIDQFIEDNELLNWSVFQGDLASKKFIEGIVSGEGRVSTGKKTMMVTYRVKMDDYNKHLELDSAIKDTETIRHEFTEIEEEDLPNIPEMVLPSNYTNDVYYIVGDDDTARTLATIVLAQYVSQTKTTFIFEKDVEYHRMTDYVTKSGIEADIVYIEDLVDNFKATIDRINNFNNKLIFLGAKKRIKYDYAMVFDLIKANVNLDAVFIKECTYEETPYGCRYVVATSNTVPDLLKAINSLRYDIDEDIMFVGVDCYSIKPVDISNSELQSVVSLVTEINFTNSCVISLEGVNIKTGGSLNDLSSIINHYSKTQNKQLRTDLK